MSARGDFTHEQKAAVAKLYLEKSAHTTMTEFRDGLVANHPELDLSSTPSQVSILNWKDDLRYNTGVYVPGERGARTRRSGQSTSQAPKMASVAVPVPATPEAIKAQIAKLQAALNDSLVATVKDLRKQIKTAEKELTTAIAELVKAGIPIPEEEPEEVTPEAQGEPRYLPEGEGQDEAN